MVCRAEGRERRAQHDLRSWHAWHTAMLGRVKRMPPLKDLQTGTDAPRDLAGRLKATMKSTLPIEGRG